MITPQQERTKYQKIWAFDEYREICHSEIHAKQFLSTLAWKPGDTVIELGCGTGRGSVELDKAGLTVAMVDITETAIDDKVRKHFGPRGLPFMEACLWEMPDVGKFDWIYCCDVLEHIPTEHVDAALQNMARMTKKGGFLSIAHFAEGFGGRINDTLHLTVEPPNWWQPKIKALWDDVWWSWSGFVSTVFLGPGK